jgi:CelD/BcsL family acetyltransferase involved in cellulose biosynthesis
MRVETAFSNERLVGAVPIEIERRRLGARVGHFMGRHHAALADVLVEPSHEREVAPRLVERLRDGTDWLDLFGVTTDSVVARTATNGRAALVERVEAPVLDLSAGWEAVYRSKTSSKRRNLHQRRRRQLSELGALTLAVARTPDDLLASLPDAFRLHEARWSGRPDGSEFTTPVGRAFHQDALRALGANDVARILTLSIDGKPVAFHYYFLLERCMYVHRLAFDPALSRFSPGLLATIAAIEAAAEEGAVRVEFLGGAERYKLEFADRTEPLYELLGLASSARGYAASRAARMVLDLRLRLKRSNRLRAFYFERLAPFRRKAGAQSGFRARAEARRGPED